MKVLSLALVFLFWFNFSNCLAQKDLQFAAMVSFGLGYRVFQSDIPGLKKLRNKTDYTAFNYTYGLSLKYTPQELNSFVLNLAAGIRGFKGNLSSHPNDFYDHFTIRRIINVFTVDLIFTRKLENVFSSPWVGIGFQGSYYRNADYNLIIEQSGYHPIARPNFGLVATLNWNLNLFTKSNFDVGVFSYVDFRSNRDNEPILDQAKSWFTGCSAYVKYYF